MKTHTLLKGACIALAAITMPLCSFGITFAGTSSGVFVNPVGPAGMTVSGVNSPTFAWGVGVNGSPPSSLTFSGTLFGPVLPEVTFSLGTLSYFNGTLNGGTEANSVDLAVTLNFSDPNGLNQAFTFPFQLINSPNVADPIASADNVELGLGSQSVFTVDGVSYTLNLGFGNFSGNALGDADTFRVLESATGTAQLQGTITTNIRGVPDTGSTLMLLGAALAALPFARRMLGGK